MVGVWYVEVGNWVGYRECAIGMEELGSASNPVGNLYVAGKRFGKEKERNLVCCIGEAAM